MSIRNYEIYEMSDAWSTSNLSHRPSKPAYYILDWRISIYVLDGKCHEIHHKKSQFSVKKRQLRVSKFFLHWSTITQTYCDVSNRRYGINMFKHDFFFSLEKAWKAKNGVSWKKKSSIAYSCLYVRESTYSFVMPRSHTRKFFHSIHYFRTARFFGKTSKTESKYLDSLEGSIEEQRPLGYKLSAIFGQNFIDFVRFSNPVGQPAMQMT